MVVCGVDATRLSTEPHTSEGLGRCPSALDTAGAGEFLFTHVVCDSGVQNGCSHGCLLVSLSRVKCQFKVQAEASQHGVKRTVSSHSLRAAYWKQHNWYFAKITFARRLFGASRQDQKRHHHSHHSSISTCIPYRSGRSLCTQKY